MPPSSTSSHSDNYVALLSPTPAPTVSCKINGVEMPASSNSTVLSQVSTGCLDDSSIEDLGKSERKTLICLR